MTNDLESKTVLYASHHIRDNKSLADSFRTVFDIFGYQMVCANNASEARDMIAKQKFEVYLIEGNLDHSGVATIEPFKELYALIQQINPDANVIGISGTIKVIEDIRRKYISNQNVSAFVSTDFAEEIFKRFG